MKKTGEGGKESSKQGLYVNVDWSGNIFTNRRYWSGGREEKRQKDMGLSEEMYSQKCKRNTR